MGCWDRTRLQDVVQLGESACRNGEKGKMQEVPGYQISHLSCPMRCLSSQARLVRCLVSRTQFTLLMPSIINPYNPYTLHNTAPYVRRKPSKAPMYSFEPLDSHVNSYPLLSPPTFWQEAEIPCMSQVGVLGQQGRECVENLAAHGRKPSSLCSDKMTV